MGASRPLVAQMVPCLIKHNDKTSQYLTVLCGPMIKRLPKTITKYKTVMNASSPVCFVQPVSFSTILQDFHSSRCSKKVRISATVELQISKITLNKKNF